MKCHQSTNIHNIRNRITAMVLTHINILVYIAL